MKILCWNVRGFNDPLTQDKALEFIREQKIDVFCALETKLEDCSRDRILRTRFPNWEFTSNFDVIKKGRILVMWQHARVELRILDISPQAIHCYITCKFSQLSYFATFVYGLYTVPARRCLWDKLVDVGSSMQLPWLVLGDFNCVLKPEEKICTNTPTAYDVQDFNDCCLALGLQDAPSSGCFFTWTDGTAWCKLDRVLINKCLHSSGQRCEVDFPPSGGHSDHSPAIISIFEQYCSGPRSFKFFNMWTAHPDFLPLVKEKWDIHVRGTSQFALCKKLKSLKGPLKELNKSRFGLVSKRAREAKERLKDAQLAHHSDPSNVILKEEALEARKSYLFLAEAERHFYIQRAKCEYLKLSDRNTRFFHDLVKRNATRNTITSVKLQNGQRTKTWAETTDQFVQFYSDLYGVDIDCRPVEFDIFSWGPILTSDVHAALTKDITCSEIKEAIFDIGDDKAPGPDGFTSCFFKKSWDVVGPLVCDAVLEFFKHGKILKQLNHTIISLIPKTSHDPTVSDYRPISCCSVIYKVITKILASRLSLVIEDLIDPCQAAFMAGRNITDNIFLAQEIIRQYSRKRISPRCMIQVDIRKAYDSVSWAFLRQILHGFGFPVRFIGWVMECVSTPSFSIALNGSLHGFIVGKKGLRQGDPMSPLLFLLCMEFLSRIIKCKTTNSEFNFHPRCEKLGISHLAFADDLMLFARGDVPSVRILMESLECFKEQSGLMVNANKSCIFTAGIYGRDLDEILETVGYPMGSLPVRYLGVPLAAQKLNVVHYAPLVDRIAAYIQAWSSNTLSYAGRLELIRSVIQGVECFWLHAFPLPPSVLERIIRLCRVFLWGSKRTPVGWDDVCRPKEEGGLGIRHLATWNMAILSKIIWNIHAKRDTLWIRWIHEVYLKNRSVWEWKPCPTDSPLFKRLAGVRDSIISSFGNRDLAIEQLQQWANHKGLISSKVYDWLRPKASPQPWMRMIWKAPIPPKFSFILWFAFRSRLPTRDRLTFLDVDTICPLCQHGLESVQHLFFSCAFTRGIWQHIRDWLGIRRSMSTLHSAVKWLKKENKGRSVHNKAKYIALACTVYMIWKRRNMLIFEGIQVAEDELVYKIKIHVYRILYSNFPPQLVRL